MAGFGSSGRAVAKPDPVREAFAANSGLLSSVFAFSAAITRAEDAKPDKAGDAKAADLDVNLHGAVRPKPKDAPENVVALFIVIPKKFDIIDERKAVNLYAKGDVVKVLLELAKERSRADISGTIVDGGINVTQAEAFTGKKKQKQARAQEKAADGQPAKVEPGKTPPGKSKASDEEF